MLSLDPEKALYLPSPTMCRHVMNVLRRATGCLASLLVLQVALAGGRVQARMHASQSSHEMTAHGTFAGPTMASASEQPDSACHARSSDDHCTLAGFGSACVAMTSCISSALAPPVQESDFVSTLLDGVPTGPAMAPATRTVAPELPPPRT